jgi:CubicO group peptidase (beta-lactamase class C family)
MNAMPVATPLDRRRFLGLASGAGALSLLPASALAQLARDNAPDWPALRAMLDRYVRDVKVPGAVGSIARGTDDAQFLSAGTIGPGDTRAMDADSLFRVYSMTKPITGMAAMMLIEDGKIGLDQDIGDFIPGFKKPRVVIDLEKDLNARAAIRPITVRNLLTHTAGLGYTIVSKGPMLAAYVRLGLNPGALSRSRIPGVANVPTAPSLEIFANRLASLPLIADPGTKWSYSVGLDLMGRVIEVASGMPFDRFLKTRIFDPLGMTSTFFRVPASETGRLTSNIAFIPNGTFPIDPGKDSIYSDAPAFPFGGAGLVMSTRDYDRFLLMLAGLGAIGRTRVMKEETARLGMSNLMPQTVSPENGFEKGQGFGAGGRVKTRADAMPSGIGTYGWGGAANTIAWVDPTNRLRACGMVQYFDTTRANPKAAFPVDFAKSVYAAS